MPRIRRANPEKVNTAAFFRYVLPRIAFTPGTAYAFPCRFILYFASLWTRGSQVLAQTGLLCYTIKVFTIMQRSFTCYE